MEAVEERRGNLRSRDLGPEARDGFDRARRPPLAPFQQRHARADRRVFTIAPIRRASSVEARPASPLARSVYEGAAAPPRVPAKREVTRRRLYKAPCGD